MVENENEVDRFPLLRTEACQRMLEVDDGEPEVAMLEHRSALAREFLQLREPAKDFADNEDPLARCRVGGDPESDECGACHHDEMSPLSIESHNFGFRPGASETMPA